MRQSDPTKESGTAVLMLARARIEELEAERDVLREAFDVQLGRHLCYTSEDSRRRFWRGVDAYLERTK